MAVLLRKARRDRFFVGKIGLIYTYKAVPTGIYTPIPWSYILRILTNLANGSLGKRFYLSYSSKKLINRFNFKSSIFGI